MTLVYKLQRVTLAVWGVWAGALGLLGLFVPRVVLRELHLPLNVPGAATIIVVLWASLRLAAGLTALATAQAARPPRALVGALAVGLCASVLGLWAVGRLQTVTAADARPFWKWVLLDGAFGLFWAITSAARVIRRTTP